MQKRCPQCNDDLSIHAFGRDRARADGRNLYCKKCARDRTAAARADTREKEIKKRQNAPPPPTREDRITALLTKPMTQEQMLEALPDVTEDQLGFALTKLIIRTRKVASREYNDLRYYFLRRII